MIECSESIAELATALAKAQADMESAKKDSVGQVGTQKTKYADMASAVAAIKEPLSQNGLSYVQPLSNVGNTVTCTTMLMHSSGQWIRDSFSITPSNNDPRTVGSAATYARRYGLMAMVGLSADDDDAQLASAKPAVQAPKVKVSSPFVSEIISLMVDRPWMKKAFVAKFGMPDAVKETQHDECLAWVKAELVEVAQVTVPTVQSTPEVDVVASESNVEVAEVTEAMASPKSVQKLKSDISLLPSDKQAKASSELKKIGLDSKKPETLTQLRLDKAKKFVAELYPFQVRLYDNALKLPSDRYNELEDACEAKGLVMPTLLEEGFSREDASWFNTELNRLTPETEGY
jgi:ERF superfamily